MERPVIVIGGVAAGMSAASKIRRLRPECSVEVYEKSSFVSYGACGLPYYLSDVITDHNRMVIRDPSYYRNRMAIDVYVRHEVLSIDTEKQSVTVRNISSGEVFAREYDKLIYATGARPIVPAVPGTDLPGVHVLRTLDDGLVLKEKLLDRHVQKVVIVGGGYIGLEVAENVRMLGKEVRIIEKAGRCLVNFDADMYEPLREELEKHGVIVHCGEELTAFNGTRTLESVQTSGGIYPCDLALLCIGVRPNSELAASAGIALGCKGAVAVDRSMRTNIPNVFAAGDCAETYHRILGKNVYIPLGTTANRQGRLAGQAACGQPGRFAGVLGTAVAKVFDLTVAVTGLTEAEAAREGIDVQSTTVSTLDHAVYYPNPRPINIKLVYDRKTARLLGGQIIGHEGVAHRIDILATAICGGFTLEELAEVDMCYAPPYKGVWEAVVVAANVAQSEWEASL